MNHKLPKRGSRQWVDEGQSFLPLSQWTDSHLVDASKNGNHDAFTELVRRYQTKVYNLTLRYTNDPEAAMDLTQDSFVRAWQMLSRFRGDSNFYTWLYRITMNLCIDHHRRQLARGENQKVSLENLAVERQCFDEEDGNGETFLDEMETKNPEAELLHKEMRQKIWEAIQKLPPKLKQLILLREYEGLSLQEISKVTGIRVGTLKSCLHQARQHLKRILSPYFER